MYIVFRARNFRVQIFAVALDTKLLWYEIFVSSQLAPDENILTTKKSRITVHCIKNMEPFVSPSLYKAWNAFYVSPLPLPS